MLTLRRRMLPRAPEKLNASTITVSPSSSRISFISSMARPEPEVIRTSSVVMFTSAVGRQLVHHELAQRDDSLRAAVEVVHGYVSRITPEYPGGRLYEPLHRHHVGIAVAADEVVLGVAGPRRRRRRQFPVEERRVVQGFSGHEVVPPDLAVRPRRSANDVKGRSAPVGMQPIPPPASPHSCVPQRRPEWMGRPLRRNRWDISAWARNTSETVL